MRGEIINGNPLYFYETRYRGKSADTVDRMSKINIRLNWVNSE